MRVLSTCRCCSAGCGISAEVDSGRLLAVQGDRSHPLSHGYLCPKGRALPWVNDNPHRLDFPVVRGERASWAEALDDLALRLSSVRDRFGGGSVGTFRGHGGHADKIGIAALTRVVQGLGSTQVYSVSSIDIAPTLRVAQIVTGTAAALPRWMPEDPASTLAVWFGGNPAVSHGYVTQMPDPVRRIRAFRERGGVLWVADPRATRTASLADHHLQLRPGTDHIVLAWLVVQALRAGKCSPSFVDCTTSRERAVLEAGLAGVTLESAVEATGLSGADLLELRDQILRAERISLISSTGVTFQRAAVLTEWLRWVLLLLTDSLDQPGGMAFSRDWFDPLDLRDHALPPHQESLPPPASRPELQRLNGEIPVAAMGDEIRAGNLRALFVNGGNPAVSFPDPADVAAFLGELEVLVALDVASSATTAIATHVLPVAGQMERTDVLAWTDDYVRVAPAVVEPAAERRPLWWIAAQLGARLGVDIVQGRDPDQLSDLDMVTSYLGRGRTELGDPLGAGPYGLHVPPVYGHMRARVLAGGRWNILPPVLLDRLAVLRRADPAAREFVLASGRQPRRSNSESMVAPSRNPDRAVASVNPADAVELGVGDGHHVRATGDVGSLVVEVQVDGAVPPGVLWMAHGWERSNVARLCSPDADLDPLTGQPVMTGLRVSLERVDPSGTGA